MLEIEPKALVGVKGGECFRERGADAVLRFRGQELIVLWCDGIEGYLEHQSLSEPGKGNSEGSGLRSNETGKTGINIDICLAR